MTPFRPPTERINALIDMIIAEMKQSPNYSVEAESEVRAIIRSTLTENLKAEYDLEQEVIETLKKHGQAIYQEKADFAHMVMEGKKMLAKKKGFIL